MPMFACSACQKQLSVKDEFVGRKVKCPGCGAVVLAMTPGNAAILDMPTLLPERPSKAEGHSTSEATNADLDASLTDFLAPAQADDELGRLGSYRILKILGHGGMGVVYRAEDSRLKRVVAIKAMLPTLAASASAGKRFLLEARAMAALEHDHIVRIYQVDEDRGVPFLAMEFLKGEPLDERLKREDGLPVPEILRIGREIAEALASAHANGLIHRDVKPGNVWLEAPRGRVKILDFGLARATSQDSGLTQQGAIMGTPAYMAPEQVRGETADSRCDLFSLGVVLYRMCTGRLPFVGTDAVSTLMAVAMHKPPAPILVNRELPQGLSDLVMKLLEKDVAKRTGTVGAVIQNLANLEQELKQFQEVAGKTSAAAYVPPKKGSVSRKPGTSQSLPARGQRRPGDAPRRRSVPLVALALVAGFGLLIAAGGVIFYWLKEGKPQSVPENTQLAHAGPDHRDEAGKAIDLLKLIDVKKHAVAGDWRFEKETLVIPGENEDSRADRLQIPFAPPEAYELEVAVNRMPGNVSQTLVIGLVVGERKVTAVFDVEGLRSGIHQVDGKPLFGYEKPVLRPGSLARIVVKVGKDSIAIFSDGVQIINWKGDARSLACDARWDVPNPRQLFLASIGIGNGFHVTRIELRPVTPGR